MAGSQPAAETRNGEAVVPSRNRLRRLFVLGGLLAGGALAACSTPTPPAPVVPVAASSTPGRPEPAPAPAKPAAMHMPELPALTGMDPAQLIALLGEPDLRRPEPPAELWQYRDADCVLDVFLYAEAGRYRVLGSATRDRHVAPPAVTSCTAAFGRRADANRL